MARKFLPGDLLPRRHDAGGRHYAQVTIRITGEGPIRALERLSAATGQTPGVVATAIITDELALMRRVQPGQATARRRARRAAYAALAADQRAAAARVAAITGTRPA